MCGLGVPTLVGFCLVLNCLFAFGLCCFTQFVLNLVFGFSIGVFLHGVFINFFCFVGFVAYFRSDCFDWFCFCLLLGLGWWV